MLWLKKRERKVQQKFLSLFQMTDDRALQCSSSLHVAFVLTCLSRKVSPPQHAHPWSMVAGGMSRLGSRTVTDAQCYHLPWPKQTAYHTYPQDSRWRKSTHPTVRRQKRTRHRGGVLMPVTIVSMIVTCVVTRSWKLSSLETLNRKLSLHYKLNRTLNKIPQQMLMGTKEELC